MLEVITLTFDGVLLGASALSAAVAWKTFRGRLNIGIAITAVGLVLLGFAHLSETLLGIVFDFVGEGAPEIVHRVLVLSGFSFLVGGIISTGREIHREATGLRLANQELLATQEDLRLSNEELKERNRQLLEARTKTATDGLTGIFNHRYFQERVRQEVKRAGESGSSVGLVMLDIDGFKRVNDSLGHLEGDRILQEVANAILSVTSSEAAYRYGGDEFVVLLPDTPEAEVAEIAEFIRKRVSALTCSMPVTVSAGWTAFPANALSADEMIYGADAAMYEAKGAGKNRVVRWSNVKAPAAELSQT